VADFVFQIDHPLVESEYSKDNYKIIIDSSAPDGACALYFSSHNIYYPNNEFEFKRKIIDYDAYEWTNIRIKGCRKHIFLRDIHKQWYLTGINAQLNSPELLLDFLRNECAGLQITAIGSSAGGYAATLYGSLLGAEKVYTFNGQMELHSLLTRSTPYVDPLIFKFSPTELAKFYDLKPFLKSGTEIFYFHSMYSDWDALQAKHILGTSITSIGIRSSHHGIPFLKCALPEVWMQNTDELKKFSCINNHPLIFSIRLAGLLQVVRFLFSEILYSKAVGFLRSKLNS
jgi:hypothetical protein